MWLWPDIEKIEKYHIIILYIAITWTIWGVCFIFTPSIILVLMCFFLPLSVLVVLFRMLRNRDRKSVNEIRHICPLRLKITYIIVSSGLLIILAVLPPCGFYHAVYHEEIAVFIKYHQHEMAQSIKQRAQKIKEKYSKIELSDSNSKKLEKILLPVTDSLNDTEKILTDIYATGFNIKLDIKPIKEPQTRSIQRLITFLRDLPLVNSSDKLSIITRMFSGLKGDLKDDKSKAKWFVEDDKIVMIEQNNKQPILYSSSGEKEEVSFFHPHYLQIKTSTYRVKISPYCIVLCSILGLILLLLMIRAIMKLIFIIDINPPVSFEGKNLICNQDLKNQIHIRMQDICPLKFTGRRIITPSEIRETSSVKSLLTLCRNPAVNEIILDNFESDLDEPQIALKKLELLEGLAPMPNKQVILKSSIDPLFLLTSRCQDPSLNEDDKNNLLLRWGTLLQGYSKLRHQNEDTGYHRHRHEFMVKEGQQIDKYNATCAEKC